MSAYRKCECRANTWNEATEVGFTRFPTNTKSLDASVLRTMSSFITTMFVSGPFPDTSPKALPPIFTLAQSSSTLSLNTHHIACEPEEDVFHSPTQSDLEIPSLPPHLNSNARTRNQFKPRNSNKGSSSYQLRQFAEATLGSGSLRKAVKLPKDEDLNEWLAVNGRQSTYDGLSLRAELISWKSSTSTTRLTSSTAQLRSSALHSRAQR